MRSLACASIVCWTAVAAAASGGAPLTVSHSGYLLGADDRPVSRTAVPMVFRLYSHPSTGSVEWQASCTVDVRAGAFAVMLGAPSCNGDGLDTADLPPGQDRWLELQVDGVMLSPRTPWTAIPMATVANEALRLQGHPASDFVLKTDVGAGGSLSIDASRVSSGLLSSDRLGGTYAQALTLSNTANVLAGDGAGLRNLDAGQLATGSIPSSRLAGTYAQALTLSNTANVLAGDGAGLRNLDAGQLTTGTIPSSRLAGTYAQALTLSNTANVLAGDGSAITAVNAERVGGKTVSEILALIPSGVRAVASTDVCDATRAGSIRFSSGSFEACTGSSWRRLRFSSDGSSREDAGVSCKAILEQGGARGSGVDTYWIDPNGGSTSDAFQTRCDMGSAGGGWTLVAYNWNVNRSFLTGAYHAVSGSLVPVSGAEAAIDPDSAGLVYTQIGFSTDDAQWKTTGRDYTGFWVGNASSSTYNMKSNTCQLLNPTTGTQWQGQLVYFGGDGNNDNGCSGGGSVFSSGHTCDDGGGGITTNNAWPSNGSDSLWGYNCISSYSPTGAYKNGQAGQSGLYMYWVR